MRRWHERAPERGEPPPGPLPQSVANAGFETTFLPKLADKQSDSPAPTVPRGLLSVNLCEPSVRGPAAAARTKTP